MSNFRKSRCVLIVDDDELTMLALAALLERAGVGVERACTPAEARQAGDCRVLVCELRLTGQTTDEGRALLAELRRSRPAAALVVFSSFLRHGVVGQLEGIATVCLPKTVRLGLVVNTILALLDGGRRAAMEVAR